MFTGSRCISGRVCTRVSTRPPRSVPPWRALPHVVAGRVVLAHWWQAPHNRGAMMKTVRLVEPGRPVSGPQAVPVPEIGPRDVLVRVKAAGTCHSDAHYRAGTSRVARPLPLTPCASSKWPVSSKEPEPRCRPSRLATEFACTTWRLAATAPGAGAATSSFAPRSAMIGKHRDGGFAEFIVAPARSVVRLPDELPFEQGAILDASVRDRRFMPCARRVLRPARPWRCSARAGWFLRHPARPGLRCAVRVFRGGHQAGQAEAGGDHLVRCRSTPPTRTRLGKSCA